MEHYAGIDVLLEREYSSTPRFHRPEDVDARHKAGHDGVDHSS
jgi:hypothetical protein